MLDFFSPDARRDPYPLYAKVRTSSPVLEVPELNAWLVFDYARVRRVLQDPETFSSRVGPDWLLFRDPPRHTKLRALLARAFTPGSIAALEPRIRELSRDLLHPCLDRGEMDLAADYSLQLPMRVIADMVGVPVESRGELVRWSNSILNLSLDVHGGETGASAIADFHKVSAEMDEWLGGMIEARRSAPADDLLTRLVQAEVEGERLSRSEILGFVQLLLVGGQETTTNLINLAVLTLLEYPQHMTTLQARPELMPAAIEEILRYRSPFQWTPRVTTREVELGGHRIPGGRRVLAFVGSANRDPAQFSEPESFDIARSPNQHIAFGHGVHFCLGAPLARLEGWIALTDILAGMRELRLASDEPWEPRPAPHVLGPERLPVRFAPSERSLAECFG